MVEKDINIEIRKLVEKGRIKYTMHEKIKIGRWILGEKIGEFIGCKGKVESKREKILKLVVLVNGGAESKRPCLVVDLPTAKRLGF